MPRASATATLSDRVRDSSRKRRQAESVSVRDQIFHAAEDLLVEEGYEGFSLRRLAERIGYTPTTIYRYYRDKDHLVEAMVKLGFAQFDHALRQAVASEGDLVARQRALWHAYIAFALEQPARYRLMFMQRPDVTASLMAAASPPRATADQCPPYAPTPGAGIAAPSQVPTRPVGADAESEDPAGHSFLVLQRSVAELVAAGVTRSQDVAGISLALWSQVHGVAALALSMPGMSGDMVAQMSNAALEISLYGQIKP